MRSTSNDAEDHSRPRPWRRIAGMMVVGSSLIGLAFGGTAALQMRANAEIPPQMNPPVSVSTKSVKMTDHYEVEEHFAGRLEPVRQTRLAFERGGKVNAILFEEGETIAEGNVVARLDTAKLEAERRRLEAEVEELQARLGLADATLRRQKDLNAKGWRSAQSYDEARFNQAGITASIARVKAAIASIDVDISKAALHAPYSGTAAARLVDEGTIVDAGTAVVELLETDVRHARIGVSVEAAQALKIGGKYRLQANGQMFSGRLIAKRPDLQTGTRTVTALFDVSEAKDVPFGEIIELILTRKINAEGIWLPISALTEGRKGMWSVLTVAGRNGEQIVSREAVVVLHIDGNRAYVHGTMDHKARIITAGTNRVIPGQRVALVASE